MSEHILSLSYGKDSCACLGAIEQLGWPLDRIVHAEVWATDTVPADLPPMVEFKAKADAIIKERWGIEAEHVCSMDKNGEKLTYEKIFYRIRTQARNPEHQGMKHGFPTRKTQRCNSGLKANVLDSITKGDIWGWPGNARMGRAQWCTGELKEESLTLIKKHSADPKQVIQYLGIAADEPDRIARHQKPGFKMPLVEACWDEAYCRQWCEENDLLSPVYTTETRGGCWFCHNQRIATLRRLRKSYPDLWALLLKWDTDSPTTFHPDGHTVHDFDRRFQLEDDGLIAPDDKVFRWDMLDAELNYRLF